MYGLRKINKDGKHYDFIWPLQVGANVKCPDWNSKPNCGGGLHILPEAIGEYSLLNGHYWCVVEFDENQMVRIDDKKAKVPECKIVYLSESPDGLKDYFDFGKFDSMNAFGWARYIGDREIMRDRITDSGYAYWWARDIGDRGIMIDKITDNEYAYSWARRIGDEEIMRERITDSGYAYYWAIKIGDKEIMRERITDSEYAYLWARDIGDVEIMRDRVTDPYWKNQFNKNFGEKPCTD